MTFEEFEHTPEHAGKQEFIAGALLEFPPAKLRQVQMRQQIHEILETVVGP